MTIYPAIDIRAGKCVRLLQGDFEKDTVYAENPLKIAEQFARDGASYMHIVDLDAAKTGVSANTSIIKDIIDAFGIKVQTGGGIRTLFDVENRINIGVSRVIIGTSAIKNPSMVREAVANFGDKIAVGIDAKDGKVAVNGWQEVSTQTVEELALTMKDLGVSTIIYTDIATDGMMSGTNVEGLKKLVDLTGLNIIASGGVCTVRDLQEVSIAGAEGAIIGQALYKGALQLKEVLQLFGEK